jgi:phospholipid/cholesterol/gamma-HCH transport system permease protein
MLRRRKGPRDRHGACPGGHQVVRWLRPVGSLPHLHALDLPSSPPLLARLNDVAKQKVSEVQQFAILTWNAVRFIFARPFYGSDIMSQMDVIGAGSLPIVLLTGFFTGMVLALQSASALQTFGATLYVGRLVTASMIRELGPVLAGLTVAGRVGSGIAAEIGSMKVTEQIDALNTMGTDPIKKLVTPRLIAAMIMLPMLTVINDFVGIVGGNVIGAAVIGIPSGVYWRTVWQQIASDGFVIRYVPEDFIQGLAKPFLFGAVIALCGSYYGLATTGGTEGVGQSTTRTVVAASIGILVVDYFLTQFLITVLP